MSLILSPVRPLRGLVVASALLTCTVASNALAEKPASSNQASTQLRYRQAAEAFRQEKWDEARRLFLALWNEQHTYDVAVSLGQTEYQLGHYAAAAGYLQFVLANIPPTERVGAADEYKKSLIGLEARTTQVKVAVDQPSAELLMDGVLVGKSPLDTKIYVEPGHHVLEAKLGDRKAVKPIEASAGAALTVDLILGPAPATAPVVGSGLNPDDGNPNQDNYTPAIIAGSVGGAALIGGVVFLLEASHKATQRDAARAQLPGTNPCAAQSPTTNASGCGDVSSLDSDAKLFRTLSFIGFGAAAVAGVTTYLVWPSTPAHSGVALRAMVLPSRAGLDVFTGLHGTF